MKRYIKILTLLTLITLNFNGWGQIAAWDFTGTGPYTTLAATTFNASLSSSSNITRGAGAASSAGANSFRTVGFLNNGIATTNTDYFQITLAATTGYVLSLSTIDAKLVGTASFCVSPGVSNQFAYSLDGTNFTLIGSAQSLIGTPATLTQINLTGISALQNVATGTTITLRYYASGQTATGGWGFSSPSAGQNGLAIGGTITASAIKPEPTNQPTAFAVGAVTTAAIPLAWTAAVAGAQAPDGYQIKLNTGAVVDPIDATDPADITAVTGGVANKKVTPGSASSSTSFTSMFAGTMYNYKIYSYTNSGTNIDFLLTSPPSLNHATLPNAVTSAVFTATATTSADISWTAASGYNSVNHSTLVFVKATSAVTTGTPTNAPSTYTANTTFGSGTLYQNDGSARCVYNGDGTAVSITGLSASTTYYILIYTVVDAINSNSTNSYSAGVTTSGITLCNTYSIPFTEGFEGGVLPSCWANTLVTGSSNWQYLLGNGGSNPATAHTGTKNACFKNSSTTADVTRLITPAIDISAASNPTLEFWHSQAVWTPDQDELRVYYKTSAGGASTLLATYTSSITAWTFESISLPNASSTYYIIFEGTAKYGYGVCLDDVYIYNNAIKPEPTNYPTSFLCGTTTSATIPLSWTAAAAGTQAPDYYLIKWSSTSYAAISNPIDGTATADDIITVGSGSKNIIFGTNSYTVPNLNQNTTYYFKIWTYTNSGININYKTTATEPQTTCTTLVGPCVDESWATNVLPTGWAQTSVTFTSNYAEFAAMNGELATIAVTNPTTLTFDLTRTTNTSAKTMYIEVSTTSQGGTYTTVSTYTHSNTTSGGTTSCTVDLSAYNSSTIYIKFRKASSTTSPWRLDNVKVTCGACTEPTSNSTTLTFSNITNTTIDFNIASLGNGNRRIIIAKAGSAVNYAPVDGSTYIASDFNTATDYNSGNRIVYNSFGSTGTINGLTPGTQYYFKVYEYNCSPGTENYYLGGTLLEGNATTTISPVTGLDVVCQTSTTATISWVAPEGNYTGVIIGIRNDVNPCHAISGDANNYIPNSVFPGTVPVPPSTSVYGTIGATPYSWVAYKGIGTTVTITGLTAGQPYQIKAYTYLGNTSSTWATIQPTTSITALGTPNITSLSSTPLDAQVQVSWANPIASCWDEIMVVARATSAVTAIPTGDGTAYTANAAYASGTAFDGGFVVYKGTSNTITTTALTNGTQYCFKVFTRSGTTWSTGVSTCATPIAGVTVFVPGSIAVVGVCSQIQDCTTGYSNGDDEISIVCFNDLATGSSFDMTDNGWERCSSGKWGNAEGFLRIRRTGSPIPKGTIITFRLTQGTSTTGFEGIYPDNDWVVDIRYNSLILNTSGDQIYFMTGGTWNNGTAGLNNATYTGGVILFAFNTNDQWISGICSAANDAAGNGRSQNSGLSINMECFNVKPGVASDYLKFNFDIAALIAASGSKTQRGWIELIKDPDNWEAFSNCNDYFNNAVNDFTTTETYIPIDNSSGTVGVVSGLWTGAGGTSDWFYCANWDNMLVPDKTVNVYLGNTVNTTVTNNCNIGAPSLVGQPSELFTEASCHNIINDLSGFSFTINNSLSKLDVYGNFTNNSTFSHSNGLVTFKGISEQTIGGTSAPSFYNLTVLNTSATGGLTISSDVTTTNILTLTDGIITTGTNKVIVENNLTTSIVSHSINSYINGNLRRKVATTGSYDLPVGTSTNYELANINLTTSTITYLDAKFNSPHSGTSLPTTPYLTVNGSNITDLLNSGFWTITPLAGASTNYDVTLISRGHTNGGSLATQHTIVKRADGSSLWNSYQANHNNATQSGTGSSPITAKLTLMNGFSDFAIARSSLSPLPVELVFFKAKLQSDDVLLVWKTASEINNDYFDIERSSNGIDFYSIGLVSGVGNSSLVNSYSFIDYEPLKGLSFYRLRQVDYNGSFSNSNIESVIRNTSSKLNIYNIYNPSFAASILINNPNKGELYLKITDMSGKIIYSKKLSSDNNEFMVEIEKDNISSGIYNLSVYNSSESVSQKIVIY